MADHLLAWDLPAPPEYRELKRIPYEELDPRWRPFFEDSNAIIDWRFVSWGGVLLDDRPLGDPDPCPALCIPALDDPLVTDAEGGSWLADHRIVFGLVVDAEARAYPKHIMEVHEMVNDTLDGRRFSFAYCTLCGSAQAYFTDDLLPQFVSPVLRTSGLLFRSNKVTFDLNTFSVIDTFTGEAFSGPLHDAGVRLTPITVVTSTWGEWKEQHPDTTVIAKDGGIGRVYDDNPLGGCDDGGPIFPVGDVDPRLPVQTQVLGVVAPDGTPLAFPVTAARSALTLGKEVQIGSVSLVSEAGGLRAVASGGDLVSHQAFWFAWSQFHPETLLWTPE